MLSPHLALIIGRDRQRELIAEAEQYRLLAAARRQRATKGKTRGTARANRRSTSRQRFGGRAGDTLVRWVDRVPVPPR